MAQGTITLKNKSTAVTGVSTTFTKDLKANDFIVFTAAKVVYTHAVESITDDTHLTLSKEYAGPDITGVAWQVVPASTMNAITMEVVSQVTEALRGLNAEKSNWQQVFSSDKEITITLPDGSTYTGPSWPTISEIANDADLASFKPIADAVKADASAAAASATAAAKSATAADTSATASAASAEHSHEEAQTAVDSAAAAKTSETNAKASATAAAASATAAAASAKEAATSATNAHTDAVKSGDSAKAAAAAASTAAKDAAAEAASSAATETAAQLDDKMKGYTDAAAASAKDAKASADSAEKVVAGAVQRTGDTMTGTLNIKASKPEIRLEGSADGNAVISFMNDGDTVTERGVIFAPPNTEDSGELRFRAKNSAGGGNEMRYTSAGNLIANGEGHFAKGVSGMLLAEDITGTTLDLNTLKITTATPGQVKYYICKSMGGGDHITNKPTNVKGDFLLVVTAMRTVSATDYHSLQTMYSADSTHVHRRYCNNGTWSPWAMDFTTRGGTIAIPDTNTDAYAITVQGAQHTPILLNRPSADGNVSLGFQDSNAKIYRLGMAKGFTLHWGTEANQAQNPEIITTAKTLKAGDLGLGSAAFKDIGTSGDTIPTLGGSNQVWKMPMHVTNDVDINWETDPTSVNTGDLVTTPAFRASFIDRGSDDNGSAHGGMTFEEQVGTEHRILFRLSGYGQPARFWHFNAAGDIWSSTKGNVAFQATSDLRYKDDVTPYDGVESLANINALELIKFVFKDDPEARPRRGIYAQQAETIDPCYVKHTIKNIQGENGVETIDRMGIDTNPLVMDALAAIQVLSKKCDALEANLAALTAKLEELSEGVKVKRSGAK